MNGNFMDSLQAKLAIVEYLNNYLFYLGFNKDDPLGFFEDISAYGQYQDFTFDLMTYINKSCMIEGSEIKHVEIKSINVNRIDDSDQVISPSFSFKKPAMLMAYYDYNVELIINGYIDVLVMSVTRVTDFIHYVERDYGFTPAVVFNKQIVYSSNTYTLEPTITPIVPKPRYILREDINAALKLNDFKWFQSVMKYYADSYGTNKLIFRCLNDSDNEYNSKEFDEIKAMCMNNMNRLKPESEDISL